jgi:alkanesulfonate monooxygenase SsuD/methylene tetrahydromethanopterin reductase-like flavin-dependent oxidoreductase (luciferase family)
MAAQNPQNRMMTLVAFLQAQNCSNLPGSWRHPATMLDFLTPEYYQRIARILEDGKIQLAFFDDRLALPDIYTGDHAEAVSARVRAVKLDPCTVIMAMGIATRRLGLGATYYEPYHVARLFATIDLMLKGRAAWNIVTSLNSAEARNFGDAEPMAHDARYDRDGFVLAATSMPGAYDDVVRLLVPELQRRGLFHKDYEGPTLRDNLNLPIPRAAAWHATRRNAGK